MRVADRRHMTVISRCRENAQQGAFKTCFLPVAVSASTLDLGCPEVSGGPARPLRASRLRHTLRVLTRKSDPLLWRQAPGRGEAWEAELKDAATTVVLLAHTSQGQERSGMAAHGPPKNNRNLEPAEMVRVRALRSGRQSAPPDAARSSGGAFLTSVAGRGEDADRGVSEGARIQSALLNSLSLLLHRQESSRVRASGT